jgi:hypothetical protein
VLKQWSTRICDAIKKEIGRNSLRQLPVRFGDQPLEARPRFRSVFQFQ